MKKKYFIPLFIIITFSTYDLTAQNPTSIVQIDKNKESVFSLFNQGKITTQEAINGFKKAQYLFLEKKAIDKYFDTFHLIAYSQLYTNHSEEAIETLKKGIQEIEKYKNNDLLISEKFKLISQLAEYYQQSAFPNSSSHYFESAYQLLKTNENIPKKTPKYVIAFYHNYAKYVYLKGETDKSQILLDVAFEYASNLENKNYLAHLLKKTSSYYLEKGDYKNTLKLLKKSEVLFSKDNVDKADVYLKLADISLKTNELAEAKEMLALAHKTFRGAGYVKAGAVFPWFEQRLQLAYGTYYGRTKKTAAAQKAFELVLAQNQRFYKNLKGSYAADAYLGLAALVLPQAAAKYCQLAAEASYKTNIEAVPKLENILSPRTFVAALAQRATYETPKKAAITYEQAMQAASQIRRSFSMPSSKFFYTERVYALYENALRAMGNQAPDKTFRFMEYSKAAVLSDVLLDQRIKLTNVSANLLTEERQLKQQLSKLQTKEPKPEEKSKIENEIRDLQIKSGFLAQKIEKSSPAYFRLKYRTDTPKAVAIQAKLDNKTAVVSYLVTNREIFISVVTKDNIAAHVVPIDTSFHLNLAKFNRLLYSNPGLESYKGNGLSQVLYKQLILPIEPLISTKKQLIFVRDGQLNYLPFEVLEKSKDDYLLHNYYISYNYSASLCLDNQSVKTKKNTSLLSVAPYANNSVLQNPYRDRSLGALPFSENEVDKIGGDIYKNNAATKQKFMEKYRSHGLIHFATHAQIDDQDPAKSFIAFYPDSSGYKLFTEELYNLSLENTQLVVLSACEAGRGSLQKGEGLMSLARGFAYAGCPAVITTLWKAHDKSTAFLGERLHGYLKKGYTKDKALQLAKIDFLTSDIGQEFDHPYYWANFILIGDTSALYAPTPVYIYAVLVAAILLLLVVGFLWYKNKRTT